MGNSGNRAKVLAVLMTAVMSLSVLSAGTVTAGRVKDAGAENKVVEQAKKDSSQTDEIAQEQTSDAGGAIDKVMTYDASVVNQNILYSHTDQSSELKNDNPNPMPAEERTQLSGEQGLYDDLGLSSSSLSNKMTAMVDDEDYQNPMSGYKIMDPNELLLGSVSSKSGGGSHKASVFALDNQELKNPEDLASSIDDIKKNTTSWLENTETKGTQAHNGIGFDCDGDGLDEFAYISLFDDEESSYDSSFGVQVYKRNVNDAGSSSWDAIHMWRFDMDTDNYILDIPAGEAKGYTAVTAGDFDGDGMEELAVYLPDVYNHSEKKCDDARIVILKFTKDEMAGKPIATVYLKDILPDYAKMGKEWYLPSVSLSTSHLRLGDPVETGGVSKYNPVCDLVINVNVPKVYDSSYELNKDSTTSIYGFAEKKILKTFEYKPSGYARMGAVNSCEADLNGDGYDEIVVAGVKEEKLKYSKKDSNDPMARGSFTGKNNYVNIIYYDGKEYQMLWTDGNTPAPMELEASGNTSPNGFKSVEPIAMCGGHFDVTTPQVQDQICIQDTIFSCKGTKISGKTIQTDYGSNGEVSYCIIPDTTPYRDKDNFSGKIEFKQLYQYDISAKSTAHATHTPWIDSVSSGSFLSENGADSIVMITSDYNSINSDLIYFDVSIISHYRASETSIPEWKYKAYNDYVDRKDEDDGGASIFATFINSDPDTYYYKYLGTSATCSTPILYTLMQAPPFFREANTIYDNEFSITSGDSWYYSGKLGVGTTVKLGGSLGVANIFRVELHGSVAVDALYAQSCTHNTVTSHSLYLKSDSDYAIVYVIPIVVNSYAVIKDPAKPDEQEYMEVQEPVKPIFTAITLNQYNDAVQSAKSRQSNETVSDTNPVFPAEYNTPIIDKDETIPPSAPGDPVGYAHEKSEVKKHVRDGGDLLTSTCDINKTIDRTETGFSKETVKDYSIEASGTLSYGASVNGGMFFQGNISQENRGSLGVGIGKTSTDGIEYKVAYTGLSASMPDGVAFSPYDNSYSSSGAGETRINHYDPSPSSSDGSVSYQYSSTACLYEMKDIKTDKDFVDDYLNGEADYQKTYHADSTVYAFSYYTSVTGIPPESPTMMGVQSIRTTGDKDADGSQALDITLAWDSSVRDPERDLKDYDMGYNLYITDENANSKTIYLVNHDGLIYRKPGCDYTTYTVHLDKNEYRDSMKFYLVPAFSRPSEGYTEINEGAIATSCSISSVKNILDGRVLITEQPTGPLIYDISGDSDVKFTCKVRKNTGVTGDVKFDWQFVNPKTNKWQSVKQDHITNTRGETTSLPQGSAAADLRILTGLPDSPVAGIPTGSSPSVSGGAVTGNVVSIAAANTEKAAADDVYEEFTSVLSATVPQNDYMNYLGRPVRCVITCGTYSLSSDIVVISRARSADVPECEMSAGDVESLGLSTAEGVNVSYKSSRKKAVKVTKTGKIYAMKKGTAIIRATYNGQTTEYKVRVKNSPKAVKKKLVMKLGQKKKIKIKGKVPYVNNKYFKNKLVRVSSTKNGKTVYLKAVKRGKGKVKIRVNGVVLKVSVTVK